MFSDNSNNDNAEQKRNLALQDEISEDEHNDNKTGRYNSETEGGHSTNTAKITGENVIDQDLSEKDLP